MSPSSIAQHESLVELRHVHVRFGQHAVLRDISLKVRRGETLAVIGESGCGKTVMLKAMIGLVTPIAGRVLFSGQDFAKLNDAELARQRTRYGFVFQQAALFDIFATGPASPAWPPISAPTPVGTNSTTLNFSVFSVRRFRK